MKKIPSGVREEIKAAVYAKADEHGYRQTGRVQNGRFMDNLVQDPEVGGKLAQFMPKAKIKTYIKDGILNRYAKDKIADDLSSDAAEIIQEVLGQGSVEIEVKKSKRLSLHRLDDEGLAVLAGGTFLKWETALRKALEYVAGAPGLPPENCDLHIVLILSVGGEPLTTGDIEHLNQALSIVGVKVFFASKKGR